MYQTKIHSSDFSQDITLLNAGLKILSNQGIAKMSVRAITEQAGVSSSLFTYRFGSKENYLQKLLDYMSALDLELAQKREQQIFGNLTSPPSLSSLMFSALYDEFVVNDTLAKAFLEFELDRSFKEVTYPSLKARHDNRVAFWEKATSLTLGQSELAISFSFQMKAVGRILLFPSFAPRTLGWVWDILNRICERLDRKSKFNQEDSAWRKSFENETRLDFVTPDENSTKARILATALEIIQKKGCAALTHRTIAKSSGISLSSLTHHYKSLNDILLHCYQSTYTKARDQALNSADPKKQPKFNTMSELINLFFDANQETGNAPPIMEEIGRITARQEETQNISLALLALQGAASQYLLRQIVDNETSIDRLDGHICSMLFSGLSIVRDQSAEDNQAAKESTQKYLETLFPS